MLLFDHTQSLFDQKLHPFMMRHFCSKREPAAEIRRFSKQVNESTQQVAAAAVRERSLDKQLAQKQELQTKMMLKRSDKTAECAELKEHYQKQIAALMNGTTTTPGPPNATRMSGSKRKRAKGGTKLNTPTRSPRPPSSP